ncbi:MAG TPA: Crp/Fnr family transcriptional regulator [Chloroflexia bacterium]|nr:Crp/Fnr family transcriptional regulator [Chloroflexia bacterium]
MLKIEFLRKLPYFAGLEPDHQALAKLAAATVEEHYERGQLLFLEGETCRGLYYVQEGRVRVFKSGPEGKEQNLRLAGPGMTFNDVPVLDGGPNPASADALEPCTVWIVPTSAVQQLLDDEPEIAKAVIKIFANRMRHLTALIGDISLRQVTGRVARILLSQVEEDAIPGIGISNMVSSQMTQAQIASTAGTVREMVGRALKSMENAGAIEAHRGHIIIKDSQKLHSFL